MITTIVDGQGAARPVECGSRKPDPDDINYLVEVKGQDRLEDVNVLSKKAAAANWARFVSDDGTCGEWRYLFVPQSEVGTSLNSLIARFTAE